MSEADRDPSLQSFVTWWAAPSIFIVLLWWTHAPWGLPFWRIMSPLVQRSRPIAKADPLHQHWSMLLFESLSAGVLAVGVGLATVLAVVGLYVTIVWPLTFWALANLGLEHYASWTNTVLWSVFAGGSLA